MGQACTKDGQTSQRSLSLGSSRDNYANRHTTRGTNGLEFENSFEPITFSQPARIDHNHFRRHERLKVLGSKSLPRENDSDANLSM